MTMGGPLKETAHRCSMAYMEEILHQSTPSAPKKDTEERILAALSYLGILFLIPMLVRKDNEFCKYHVRQGIVLFAIDVLLSFGFLHAWVGAVLSFIIFIVSIIAIVRTLQGVKWELPLVGKYAQKITL